MLYKIVIFTFYHILIIFFSKGKYFPYSGQSYLRLSSKGISSSLNVFHLSCIHTIQFDWQKIGEKTVITSLTNKGTVSGDYFCLKICFVRSNNINNFSFKLQKWNGKKFHYSCQSYEWFFFKTKWFRAFEENKTQVSLWKWTTNNCTTIVNIWYYL